jgi:hypothetical protein
MKTDGTHKKFHGNPGERKAHLANRALKEGSLFCHNSPKILPASTWQCSRHHHMLDESTVAAQFQAEVL